MALIDSAYSVLLNKVVHISDFTRDEVLYKSSFLCPECNAELIARKGSINRHHFASKAPHKKSCVFYKNYHKDDGSRIKIDVTLFIKPERKAFNLPFPTDVKGITSSRNCTTLQQLVELDHLFKKNMITRKDIRGIEGRNWENFYIKSLNKTIVKRIESNQNNKRSQVYVFKGVVHRVWNTPYEGFITLRDKHVKKEATQIRIHILRGKLSDKILKDFNNPTRKKQQIAVIGVPRIQSVQEANSMAKKIITFSVNIEHLSQQLYQIDT